MPRLSTSNLTDSRIQRLKVEPRTRTYWDMKIRGFGLQVTPHGAKTFYFKFLAPGGGQAWMNLGRYTGPESLDIASEKAGKYRGMVEDGKDPRAEVQKVRSIPTLAEFISEYLELVDERRAEGRLTESTERAIKACFTRFVGPVLGELRISEVERFHVEALHRDIAKGWRPGMKKSEKPPRATPILANRMLAHLSALFTEAERRGLRPQGTNPCKLVGRKAERRVQRFLSPVELEWLGKTLRESAEWQKADDEERGPAPTFYALAALRLLILTGARLNEILRLQWSQVDFERRVITWEKHKTSGKTGAKQIPINAAVEATLKTLQDRPERHLGSPWVIQGHKHRAPMVNLSKPWLRIKRAITKASEGAVNIEDVRLHDLRHGFATAGVSAGLSLPQIGGLLGHSQPSTTQRYAHADTDPMLKASEEISGRLVASLGA